MAVIGLFGGSFNPPHIGHIGVAEQVLKRAGLDQVWMMVTPGSPLKDPAQYAALPHRMAMCDLSLQRSPQKENIVITDIEKGLPSTETADVLKHIMARYPEHTFVWIMGSDNLLNFHKWSNWQFIMDTLPIAVMYRPGQDADQASLQSPAAQYGASIQTDNPKDLKNKAKGWCLIDGGENMTISSSAILKSLQSGKRNITGLTPDVERYILRHKLYGLNASRAPKPPKP